VGPGRVWQGTPGLQHGGAVDTCTHRDGGPAPPHPGPTAGIAPPAPGGPLFSLHPWTEGGSRGHILRYKRGACLRIAGPKDCTMAGCIIHVSVVYRQNMALRLSLEFSGVENGSRFPLRASGGNRASLLLKGQTPQDLLPCRQPPSRSRDGRGSPSVQPEVFFCPMCSEPH
jgi:hypothetical protein